MEDINKETLENIDLEDVETEVEIEEEIDENEKKINELNLKVTELEGVISSLKNDYARAYADTENIKKRLNNEHEQIKKYRAQQFALDILPVIDNLERALKQETKDEDFKKGIEMIYTQLMDSLSKEGVTKMDPLGKEFDANYHQAIMSEKVEETESNIVLEVFQQGYMLKDRILRAAMVKISE